MGIILVKDTAELERLEDVKLEELEAIELEVLEDVVLDWLEDVGLLVNVGIILVIDP